MDNEENGAQTCDQYILGQYKKLQEQNENLMKMNEQLKKDNDFMSGVINFVNTKCTREKEYLSNAMSFQCLIRFRYGKYDKIDDDTERKLNALGFKETDEVVNVQKEPIE